MKIVEQGWNWNNDFDGKRLLRAIEIAGRTCYKSEDKITDDSAEEFVRKMLRSGHHAMIEFAVPAPVKVITDRGVTHEIVRHRLFSFAQESTRYCNYSRDKHDNQLQMIRPVWFIEGGTPEQPEDRRGQFEEWYHSMRMAEETYMSLIKLGQSPQEARSVLPNSLKTEINICGNVREWRHFFKLRCSPAAHPQIRELALSMLKGFSNKIPVIFGDLYWEYISEDKQ